MWQPCTFTIDPYYGNLDYTPEREHSIGFRLRVWEHSLRFKIEGLALPVLFLDRERPQQGCYMGVSENKGYLTLESL